MSRQQEERDKLWDTMYRQLLKFNATYGNTRVPSTWHNKSLAKWVSRQRENESVMDIQRKKKLNTIGFSWHKDMQQLEERAWEVKYEQLIKFYKKYGHYQVPNGEEHYHSLRSWVDKQRVTEGTMPPHRKKLLDVIKFRWQRKIKADLTESWNSMYKELTHYYNKYGNCRVSSHSTQYPQLGPWVSRQRRHWEKLDKRKRKKLEELDFTSSAQIDKDKRQKWLTMLAILKRYKNEYGHCRVPSKYKKNPELGRWVEVQRLEEKNIPTWKKERLDALGFEWSRDIQDNRERRWYTMYDKLENFYKRFGHSSVPEYWKGDRQLAIWASYQRRPKQPLAKEKISLLNQLSFQWKPRKGRPRKRNDKGQFATEV